MRCLPVLLIKIDFGLTIQPQTVLVTGGAGYIGSHVCKALSRAGFWPIAFDNLVYGREHAVKWGPLERGDILDRARLDQVIAQYNPAAILHFAAFAYVGESVANPGKYYRNNVMGSITLLEAARDHGIKNFIFSSSCATYGNAPDGAIAEIVSQKPINPYGRSKLMVEQVIKDFNAAHDGRSMILRYFNAAGADPDGQIGEEHDPETHLIPLVLDAVSGRRKGVTVFGTDYPTKDGTCIRDYVHVSDLAEAHVLALRALFDAAPSNIYNLGTGSGYSVQDVINAAESITGKSVPVSYGARREGDPAILVSDASKIRRDLHWKPAHSDLQTIIRTAWSWQQKNRVSKGLVNA